MPPTLSCNRVSPAIASHSKATVLGIVAFLSALQGVAAAGELSPQWITLSNAAARLHYRGHVRSDRLLLTAAGKIKDLQRDADASVRKAADELYPLLAGAPALEQARDNAGMDSTTQSARRDRLILNGILNPNGIDKEFGRVMADQVRSATDFARAQQQLQKYQLQRLDVWQQRVRPIVEATAGPEAEGPPPVEVQFGLLSRDLWISLRNNSKQDLHACALQTITRQQKSPDQLGVWFIPELRQGETIQMEPFHGYGVPKPGTELATQKRNYSVEFSFWSNELRVDNAQAKSVDGYKIRDPFMANLISSGREYETADEQPTRLQFTQFRRSGAGSGRVRALLVSADGKKTPYSGDWHEDRNSFQGFHPAVLQLTLRQGHSAGNKRAIGGMTLRWQDGAFNGGNRVFFPVAIESPVRK